MFWVADESFIEMALERDWLERSSWSPCWAESKWCICYVCQSEPPKRLTNSNNVTLSSHQQVQWVIFLMPKIALIFVLKLSRCFRFIWSGFTATAWASVRVKVSVNFIGKMASMTWKLKFEAPYNYSSHSSNRTLWGSALSHMVQDVNLSIIVLKLCQKSINTPRKK